jgi:glycosyltransferase involved in cell wall biosynthesis
MEHKEVTFCLTSYGKIDELEKTIDSFLKFNDYPIKEWFIIEDSGDTTVWNKIVSLNNNKWNKRFKLIFNSNNIGLTASIDKMYANVQTDYIFHCEHDWEFYKGGFIEDSLKVLESQPKVLQVWIRPKSDKISNPIEKRKFTLPGGVTVRRVLPVSFKIKENQLVDNYMGFSWNPGLRRKSDWEIEPIRRSFALLKNMYVIDLVYKKLGYMVVSLSQDDEDGYVKHIKEL